MLELIEQHSKWELRKKQWQICLQGEGNTRPCQGGALCSAHLCLKAGVIWLKMSWVLQLISFLGLQPPAWEMRLDSPWCPLLQLSFISVQWVTYNHRRPWGATSGAFDQYFGQTKWCQQGRFVLFGAVHEAVIIPSFTFYKLFICLPLSPSADMLASKLICRLFIEIIEEHIEKSSIYFWRYTKYLYLRPTLCII